MTDAIGPVGHNGPNPFQVKGVDGLKEADGSEHVKETGFNDVLKEEMGRVNELQQDAQETADAFAAGRRDDIEEMLVATRKADAAYQMLVQVRSRLMEAYQEIKQLRE